MNPLLDHDQSQSVDSKLPRQKQAWLHCTLVHDLFDVYASAEMLRLISNRLHDMIARGIPICTPGDVAITNHRTLKSFFTYEWTQEATPVLLCLVKAYVENGYLDIHDTHLPLFDDPVSHVTSRGSLLQSAIEWRKPELVRLFLAMGSDVTRVPINEIMVHQYQPDVPDSEAVELPRIRVERGDAISFAHAYLRPDDMVLNLIRQALMHKAISQSTPEGDAMANQAGSTHRGRRSRL